MWNESQRLREPAEGERVNVIEGTNIGERILMQALTQQRLHPF